MLPKVLTLQVPPPALPAPVLAPIRHKIQAVKLSEVTPVLTSSQQRSLGTTLVHNLLRTYNFSNLSKADKKHRLLMLANILALASQQEIRDLENVLLSDIAKHCDLLEMWLFSLHAASSDFTQLGRISGRSGTSSLSRETQQDYSDLLVRIVRTVLPQCIDSTARESLCRLLLSCPTVPAGVVTSLVECSLMGPDSVALVPVVSPLLRDLALWRYSVSSHTLTLLCSIAMHADQNVRDVVIQEVEAILLSGGSQADVIVEAGKRQLHYLEESQPPDAMFAQFLGRHEKLSEWDEPTVRACLQLPFTILPLHQALVHE